MNGVKFGTKHSYRDLKLILTSKDIGLPRPKTEKIDVFGMDGELDVTDAISDILRYGNRPLSFTFEYIGSNFMKELEIISNYLHGEKVQIILDDDPNFYYVGRCTINKFKTNKATCTFQIDVDAEPYKLEINKYSKSVTLNGGSTTVTLNNLKKTVIPDINCSGNGVKLSYKGHNYLLHNGVQKYNDFQLDENNNTVTLTGNGTVTFTYKRGSL